MAQRVVLCVAQCVAQCVLLCALQGQILCRYEKTGAGVVPALRVCVAVYFVMCVVVCVAACVAACVEACFAACVAACVAAYVAVCGTIQRQFYLHFPALPVKPAFFLNWWWGHYKTPLTRVKWSIS